MDTREAIKAEFMKEYAQKDFRLITVKALCAATPVARTTFYSYFDNTDDVCREVENDLIKGLLKVSRNVSSGNMPDMDFNRFMDEIERYIKDNWTNIYAFLVRQLNLRFIRKWKNAIVVNFRKRYPKKQSNRNYDAIAEMLASSVISAYTYWMEHPDTCDTKEIKPLLHKVLNSPVAAL